MINLLISLAVAYWASGAYRRWRAERRAAKDLRAVRASVQPMPAPAPREPWAPVTAESLRADPTDYLQLIHDDLEAQRVKRQADALAFWQAVVERTQNALA